MQRKGEGTFSMKRRRMPYVAKIRRDDPFRPADRREIEVMVKRIAAAGEHFSIAGNREDAGFLLFHVSTWAKARTMEHWNDPAASRTGRCRRHSSLDAQLHVKLVSNRVVVIERLLCAEVQHASHSLRAQLHNLEQLGDQPVYVLNTEKVLRPAMFPLDQRLWPFPSRNDLHAAPGVSKLFEGVHVIHDLVEGVEGLLVLGEVLLEG